jgi:hypothetical protein
VEVWVDSFDIAQRDGFVQQLLVEWKSESGVETVTVEHSNAKYPSHKVEVREMVRIYA